MDSEAMQWFRKKTIAKNHGWHESDDGLGIRRVFLNDKEIKCVIRCNELRGKAVVIDSPIRLDKHHKKVRTHVVAGLIRVEFA